MFEQRHIINRQVLEIHMPEQEDVSVVQAAISRLYQEKLVPIINELCDRINPSGKPFQIANLYIDLGAVRMEDIPEVFAEKLAEAIEEEAMNHPGAGAGLSVSEQPERTPIHILSYYLATGIMPWWATTTTKADLHTLLDTLQQRPGEVFRAMLREVGQKTHYRTRFMQTFTELQVQQALAILAPEMATAIAALRQEFRELGLQPTPLLAPGETPQRAALAFGEQVFAQVAQAREGTSPAIVLGRAIQQTLAALGANFAQVLRQIRQDQPASALAKWTSAQDAPEFEAYNALRKVLRTLKVAHRANPMLQAFHRQLDRMMQHPGFPRLGLEQFTALQVLLQRLLEAQPEELPTDPEALQAITKNQLIPVSRHLQQLEKQLQKQPQTEVIDKLHSSFDEAEFITVENAGLVILWPFLQRFFENLECVRARAFVDEAAQNKAASVLQYLVDKAGEELFEGQMSLNKILCGIELESAIVLEPLTEEEQAIADGLLEAVIARGPHWKNLSLEGFRGSYLQREGSLRSRDGHWLLQVKKETYDITLEKLPWGFNAVKLPWMNQILLVEWM